MLDVLFNQQLVGKLWSQDRILYFQYDETWRSLSTAFALSPRLPLSDELYHGDEPTFFFSNLLPEGPMLNAILKLKKLPAGDLYAQLDALGEEAAGAFSIVDDATIKQRQPHYQAYKLDNLHADIQLMTKNIPLQLQHNQLRLSLAGAQNKLPVKYAQQTFWLPADGAASTHILKPQIIPAAAFPDSVWNEAFCLRLAKMVGLNVVNIEVLNIPEPVLLIERYDRQQDGNEITRIHQLDFCQLAGFLPDQKYEKYNGPTLAMTFNLIDKYAHLPARDRLQALNWVIFNFLIGNADAHAKNLAMLVAPGNKMNLAPFYDILATAIYPSLSDEMAMTIGHEDRPRWVHQQQWHEFAQQVDINFVLMKKQALSIADQMNAKFQLAANSLNIPLEHRLIKNIHKVMLDRIRKLKASIYTESE
ncbi:MAG: type II toxin-antitoxin system HipA family toxin [Gammaproteobacteria bacterium]